MFRAIPVSNRICFDKDLKRTWRIHEEKLRRLKGSVGKQKPQEFIFLDQRLKKTALQEVKNIEIERQNNILLRKMREISNKGCKNSYSKPQRDESMPMKKTLNQPYRKRELIKIVGQNQEIMKRIHEKKSAYNIRKMEKERREVQNNISLISEFPFKNYPARSTPTNLWMTAENFGNKCSKSQVKTFPLSYTCTRKINNGYYVISSHLKNQMFYISMQNLERASEKYRLQLEEDQVRKLLASSYENCLEKLIESLQIDQQEQSCYLKYQIKSAHH